MTSREALRQIKKIEIVNAIDKWGCEETVPFEEVFDFESEMEVSELLKIIEKDLDDLEKYEKALDAIARTMNPAIIIINDQYYLTIHGEDLIAALSKEEGEILFDLFGGTNYDTK